MKELQKGLAVSVRGASHYKDNKPMQDYSASVVGDKFAIAVVCDGHGADKHFRSEIGSKLATEIALTKLQDFYGLNSTYEQLNTNTSLKIERLKLAIISDWQAQVEKYTKDNPFTEAEMAKASPRLLKKMSYDVSQPYGSTLLASLVCQDYYLSLMIGDGAIIKIGKKFAAETVSFEGKVEYTDAPHSATDSLCQEDVHEKLFVTYGKIEAGKPFAMALCSDGFTESLFFPKESDLIRKANNYLNFYAEEGLEKATEAVEAQLNEITKGAYPWDDISIAYCTLDLSPFDKRLWKEEVVEQPSKTDDAEQQQQQSVEQQPAKQQFAVKQPVEPKAETEQKDDGKAEKKVSCDVAVDNADDNLSEDDFAQDVKSQEKAVADIQEIKDDTQETNE